MAVSHKIMRVSATLGHLVTMRADTFGVSVLLSRVNVNVHFSNKCNKGTHFQTEKTAETQSRKYSWLLRCSFSCVHKFAQTIIAS